MVATQPTFTQVLNMAYLLPFGEQQQLIDYVQGNIFEHIHRVEDTPEELHEAYHQAQTGEVYSHEEAHRIMHEYVESRISQGV